MPEIPPRQLAVWAVAAVAVTLLAVWLLARGGPEAAPAAAPAIKVADDAGGDATRVVVHVAGEVRSAGVYRLRAGARVSDAVERAGGATRRADLSQVNLAAKVEDGRQILVPRRIPVSAAAAAPTTAPGQPTVPVNLNTATLEQLDALSGVGPVTAQKIIDYREEHGGFGSVDELGEVPGIGDVRLASLREQVRV
ncbi:MAG TPA: helix-hairpin-helix domain-containing protein [Solirubrobacteraceae bacterium]|nr:helix-hairpin-helix domain-containing protein [Solirubrobacteraceae bacterium]